MTAEMTDPWAGGGIDDPAGANRRVPRWLVPLGVWMLGAFAPVSRVIGHGPNGVRGALVIALATVLSVVLLRWLRPMEVDSRAAAAMRWAPPVLILAIGWLASVPVIGRAPGIVAAAGVVAADLVLEDGRRFARWPRRPTSAAPLAALPLVFVAATWLRSGSVMFAVVGLFVCALVLDQYHRRPEAQTRAERWVSTWTVRVANGIALVVVAVIAVPLLYLPGAIARVVGWLMMRVRGSRSVSWSSRADDRSSDVTNEQRPFVFVQRRRNGVGRVAAGLAICLVAVAVITMAVIRGGDIRGGTHVDDIRQPDEPRPLGVEYAARYSELAVFDGVPFADGLQREQLAYKWNMSGRYTNVEDGVRRSLPAPGCKCRRASLWIFGGSAAFGIGQRDEHTIASELVRLAAEDGIALTVKNLASPGDTIWDQYQVLRRHLIAGEVAPDVVVFYDGFNDVVARLAMTALHGVDRDARSLMVHRDLMAYIRELPSVELHGGAAGVGVVAAEEYLEVKELVDRLAAEEGISTLNLFQSDAISSDVQLAGYEEIVGMSPQELRNSDLAVALDAAEQRLSPQVRSLRHLFDHDDEQVFIGVVHTDEIGARRSAEAIYQELADTLDRHAS